MRESTPLEKTDTSKGYWELIVGPLCMEGLYLRASVSKNMQQLISATPLLPYHVALTAKDVQYDHENIITEGKIFVRLAKTKSEQEYLKRLKNIRVKKVKKEEMSKYLLEEGGKLRIKGGTQEDLPRIKACWKKAKLRPAFIPRAFYVFTSFTRGLLGLKHKVDTVSLPFPLFREPEVSIFSGTKAEAREMIFEELRKRYEQNRDIQKVPSKLVLTPNLDHIRMLYVEKSVVHKEIYSKAWLQVADGYPPLITFGKQSLGYQPKEQITGVDLFMELINLIGQGHLPYTIYFVGGFGNVPYRTRDYFISIYPHLKDNFVGISTPPLGFLDDKEKMDVICDDINKKKPDIVFVGLTTFTQEKFPLALVERKVNFGMAFGVGRSIELVVGYQKRPPKIFKVLHLEWLHRMFTINKGKGLGKFRYFNRVFDDFKFAFRSVFVD